MSQESLHAIMIRIVAGDNSGGPQMRLKEPEHVEIERLGSIKEDHVDVVRRIGQSLQGIANAKLNQFFQAGGGKVLLCPLRLLGIEFCSDHLATPLSRMADARKIVEIPNEVPNSTTVLAWEPLAKNIKEVAKLPAHRHVGLPHGSIKTVCAGIAHAGFSRSLSNQGVVLGCVGIEGIKKLRYSGRWH